jgi:hypothetical protein
MANRLRLSSTVLSRKRLRLEADKSALLYDFAEENEELGEPEDARAYQLKQTGRIGRLGRRRGSVENVPGQDFANSLEYY